MFGSKLSIFGFLLSAWNFACSDLLEQHELMESLIGGIQNKERIHGIEKKESPELSSWNGLSFDPKGSVVQINWSVYHLEGSIDLQWLPQSVQMAFFWMNMLFGSADLSSLPAHMHVLDLSKNSFSGLLDLVHLPRKMEKLDGAFNRLNGTLNLENLPSGLLVLLLNNNDFSGSVSLCHLPHSIEVLNLHTNHLVGSLDLTHLPEGMKKLYLAENNFTGEPDFTHLPKSLTYLDIIHIWLPGEVVLAEDETLASQKGGIFTLETLILVGVVIVAVAVLSLIIWAIYVIVRKTLLRAGSPTGTK